MTDDYQDGDQLLPGEGEPDWQGDAGSAARDALDNLYNYEGNIEYNIQRSQTLATLSVSYAILALIQEIKE